MKHRSILSVFSLSLHLDKEAFEPFKAIFDIVQSNIREEAPLAANS